MGLSTERATLHTAMLCIMIAGCGWLAAPISRSNGELVLQQGLPANADGGSSTTEGLKSRASWGLGAFPGNTTGRTDTLLPTSTSGNYGKYSLVGSQGGKETISGALACSRVQAAIFTGGYQLGEQPLHGDSRMEQEDTVINTGECAMFSPQVGT